jgi:hypothetical protein
VSSSFGIYKIETIGDSYMAAGGLFDACCARYIFSTSRVDVDFFAYSVYLLYWYKSTNTDA